MITISTTHVPATELGFLLHKNPGRVHAADVSFGKVAAFYPEANEERATIAVVLEIDPIKLVRKPGQTGASLKQYVNDRPFVASSFLSVALAELFRTAMSGRSNERPELAPQPIPLEIRIPVVRCRAGESAIRELFEPLGYDLQVRRIPLDEKFPEWGESDLYDITLKAELPVGLALRHLYVLAPVLDASKHYYMEQGEVDKLLSKGEGWLAGHPKRDWIVRSYLGRRPSLLRSAMEQLANLEPDIQSEDSAVDDAIVSPEEDAPSEEPKMRLHDARHARVVEIVRELRPRTVVDLGCGTGKLVRKIVEIQGIEKILGLDVSYFDLERAERYLHLATAGPRLRERVKFIHGSLTYRDERLKDFELATVVEVIEHLDPPRLAAFEDVVFNHARPRVVVLTTPNRDYNEVYGIESRLRHEDHRFEWTRVEFEAWCNGVLENYGYRFEIEGIGEAHELYGSPSLLAVFKQ